MEEIEEARLTVSLGKLAPFQLQFGFKHTRVTLNIEHLQLLQLTTDEKSHSTPQYDLSKSLNNRIYADFLFDWKMRKNTFSPFVGMRVPCAIADCSNSPHNHRGLSEHGVDTLDL